MLHRAPTVREMALSCLLVLAWAFPGAAQTEADADALLREGVAFAEAGEHARAVAWFDRARAIAPSDRIDVNLAESLIALGEYTRAETLLIRLASDIAVNPLTGDAARERLARLRERRGVVTVDVSPVPENAWLSVDGRRIGEARETTEVPAFPGTLRIAIITETGTELARARATVEERGRTRVQLAPVTVPELPPPRERVRYVRVEVPVPAPSPPPPDTSVDPWPWIGGTIAVLVAVAAGIGIGAAIWAPTGDDIGTVAFGSM